MKILCAFLKLAELVTFSTFIKRDIDWFYFYRYENGELQHFELQKSLRYRKFAIFLINFNIKMISTTVSRFLSQDY